MDILGRKRYHPRPMFENRIPKLVNVARACQQEICIEGLLSGNELQRLGELDLSLSSPVDVDLIFKRDKQGLALVMGHIKAQFILNCERCLKEYDFTVDTELNWAIVKNDEEAKQVQKEYEPVIETEQGEFELIRHLEDELLLNIPLIPMHDEQSQCLPRLKIEMPCEAVQQKINPFAELNKIVKKTKRKY